VIDPAGPIPGDTVGRIFEPLFTTKQGGNGLGLAIARNIVRAHGGDIVLRINEPELVCFSIEIPAHPIQLNRADGNNDGQDIDRR
jgi:signal transduction histidine kinase